MRSERRGGDARYAKLPVGAGEFCAIKATRVEALNSGPAPLASGCGGLGALRAMGYFFSLAMIWFLIFSYSLAVMIFFVFN